MGKCHKVDLLLQQNPSQQNSKKNSKDMYATSTTLALHSSISISMKEAGLVSEWSSIQN